eukprot:jgi/Mesen1/4351/ME000022S03641
MRTTTTAPTVAITAWQTDMVMTMTHLNGVQRAIVAVADLTRLTALADFFRESIRWSSVSLALTLLAAAVGLCMKSTVGFQLYVALLTVAFTITGVPALLDGLLDIGGGHINIHVLMAVAAFVSLFMGEAFEGALLLAMFSFSHSVALLSAAAVATHVTLFHFEDKVRPGAKSVITQLQDEWGASVLMLTGDHEASARRVAQVVGIHERDTYAGLKPEDKLARVRSLADAAVLAERASATAVAAADVLLLQSDISAVPFVMAKAQQTVALVKQNVALALFCLLVAAVSALLGAAPLWLTVLVHEGGTILVGLNSVRAFNKPHLKRKNMLLNIKNFFSRVSTSHSQEDMSLNSSESVPLSTA